MDGGVYPVGQHEGGQVPPWHLFSRCMEAGQEALCKHVLRRHKDTPEALLRQVLSRAGGNWQVEAAIAVGSKSLVVSLRGKREQNWATICKKLHRHRPCKKGRFTQEPWPWNCESPKESVQRPLPTHLPNHVVWSRALKCSVKAYVTGPSTKYYFNEFLFMRVLTHDNIE